MYIIWINFHYSVVTHLSLHIFSDDSFFVQVESSVRIFQPNSLCHSFHLFSFVFITFFFFNSFLISLLGTLTVNVSVLLLSLASPDESSLVSLSLLFVIANFPSHLHFISLSVEIWGWISSSTTMVRPPTAILERIQFRLRVLECNSSLQWHLATWHIFHHAWRLQRSNCTNAFRPKNLQKWNHQLSNEVRAKDSFYTTISCSSHIC